MSKSVFCSGWFALYLTPAPRKVVGVEVYLLCWSYACPAPPCKLVVLDLVLWWFWTGWTAMLFFLFLCSWFAGDLPSAACRWIWLRVYCGGLYTTLSLLSWSIAWLIAVGDSSLCLCVVLHAHMQCELPVCVYAWCFALGCERISSAAVDHILPIPFLSNLPSGSHLA